MAENTEFSEDTILYCSFCEKSQHEVKQLIAGYRVYICDECVMLCADIVTGSNGDAGRDRGSSGEQ